MRVELVVGGRGGRFPASNCLLVKGARAWVLVDAGCGRERLAPLRGRVDAVVYTHVHPDHVSGHPVLAGVPSYVPEADAAYETLGELARRYAPEAAGAWLSYVRRVFGLTGLPEARGTYGPWGEVRVGDVSLVMVPARGHTRGHHMVLAGGHAHLSDVDLTGFGPWYGHPESSIEAFQADIEAAAGLGAESYTTSHRERAFTPGELGVELERYRAALDRQARAVLEAARKAGRPVQPRELVGRGLIYRRYLPGMEEVMAYFEGVMIEKLLDHLACRGALRKTGRGYEPARVSP